MTMVDNSKNAIGDEMAETNGAQTPGDRLRCARQQAGLAVADVARQLNLLEWQVNALEQDRYEKFPADLFVRGYLRNYARLLKLDVDPILNAHRLLRPRAEQAARPEPRRPVTLDTTTRQRRYWGVGAAALVVLALWSWQQSRQQVELTSLTADGAGIDVAPAGGIEAALNGGAEAALLDSVQLVSAPAPSVAAEVAPAVDAVAPQPAEAAGEATDDQLSLRFSADCWVEIKDRDNKLLVAGLKHADDELKIAGRGPFKVLLGYAPGVEMAYNGTPVKVDAPDRSRSARIIVGNS